MPSAKSAGRKYPEPEHPYRAPFQRDRDRIVHSAAYRRLSHKTQVFTGELGDYHRTRLTHTLEVASVARTLARALRLNEDLAEALALLHDIGHPPFGHAGEEMLGECLAPHGGFDHNRQALRIVEELEQRYPGFPGLNLSQEVLDGQAYRARKHTSPDSPLLEVQVVEAADSVAYDTHDADDALQIGLLGFEELLDVPLWKEAVRRVESRWMQLKPDQLRRSVIHELIDWQVSDLLTGATQRLAEGQVDSIDAVLSRQILIHPGHEMAEKKVELERFLFDRVYRHPQVLAVRRHAQDQLQEMFGEFSARPELMPPHFLALCEHAGVARSVGDYLAGMSDRFAQQQFQQLCRRRRGAAAH
ncbi:MAG: dNTP triphosphohydrolase [Pirellulales bacterium]|nr:dNTP triphosphohydrolase [Pirellulales bacterium]